GYEQIIASQPNTELAQLAQIRLGDLFWAEGKEDEAKKAYEEATKKFPGLTAFQNESENRLNWIAASLPTKEVDPPPAPKPDPKATPPAAGLPGMPNINLKAAESGIGATIAPPGAATKPLMLTPGPATPPAPPTPPPSLPKSATSPAVEVPATPAPAAPAPTPAPAAPAPTPPPAPATTPAAPASPPPAPAPPAAPAPSTPPAPAPAK
ncbi:MAG: hypothetical protein JNG86_09640, partial [Verrucomicrobiaceae bacterium]|nr:hypothetical protein [Verrucomicrobiaceae bacterium]